MRETRKEEGKRKGNETMHVSHLCQHKMNLNYSNLRLVNKVNKWTIK